MLSRLIDLVLPPLCLGCGSIVAASGALCGACFGKVTFIEAPFCDCCGTPFEVGEAAGTLCGACIRRPPPYRHARAAMVYDDGSRGLLLKFKHADRTDVAPGLSRWMARAGAGLLRSADVLVPVPIHRRRLFARRYNQAALLCRILAAASGADFAPDAMVRTRRTAPQGDFDRLGRMRNVKNAFLVARPEAVQGRRVLLIDDVLTTGATVSECTKTLLVAGAQEVAVLTVARVVRQ